MFSDETLIYVTKAYHGNKLIHLRSKNDVFLHKLIPDNNIVAEHFRNYFWLGRLKYSMRICVCFLSSVVYCYQTFCVVAWDSNSAIKNEIYYACSAEIQFYLSQGNLCVWIEEKTTVLVICELHPYSKWITNNMWLLVLHDAHLLLLL